MTLIQQNLRSDVFRSSTNSVSSFPHNFGESEVNEFQVTVISNHNILRFEVSIHDFFSMQILENTDDLSSVESK